MIDARTWQAELAAVRASIPGEQDGRALAMRLADAILAPLAHAALPPGCALLALGGLARREMMPFSDVDVLLLVRDGAEPGVEERAAAAVTPLWDAGLRPALSVHSPASLDGLYTDVKGRAGHAATALLDARVVAGDLALGRSALKYVRRVTAPARREALLEAKLHERARRRERHGSSPYLNEPDVKEGAGGLRDLHTLLWAGLLSCGEAALDADGDTLVGLLRAGWLREREVRVLRAARATLLRVRIALHLGCGRKEERLVAENAARAGGVLYGSSTVADGERAAREVVRAAAVTAQIVEDVLRRQDARRVPQRPPVPVGEGFFLVSESLHLADDVAASLRTLVDAERVAAEQGVLLDEALVSRREAALEALTRAGAAPSSVRDDAEGAAGAASFRALVHASLRGARTPGPFSALLVSGVLRHVVADIARLDARVTHDGIHQLTTDAHLCICADHALAAVSRTSRVPAALEPCLARVTRPHLLVLAAFLHDIGKGLPGDHSEVGEDIAAAFSRWLELAPDDAETLAFLVRDHLVLSHAAQRRDLSDPAVIDELARRVRTVERLDLLALLTWVDMQAVSPGVATEWKGQLLRTAVDRCRERLLSDGSATLHDDDLRAHLLTLLGGDDGSRRFLAGASSRFLAARSPAELALDRDAFVAFTGELVTTVTAGDGVHEVRTVVGDRAGLLASLAGGLASESASILDAILDTRADGLAFDVFVVDDGRGQRLDDAAAARIPVGLARALAEPARAPRRGAPRARVEPRVRVLPSDSWGRPVLEVRAADRVGLLAELAQAVSDQGFSIALARIHTEGARVTDVFTVERIDRSEATPAQLGALQAALLGAVGGRASVFS